MSRLRTSPPLDQFVHHSDITLHSRPSSSAATSHSSATYCNETSRVVIVHPAAKTPRGHVLRELWSSDFDGRAEPGGGLLLVNGQDPWSFPGSWQGKAGYPPPEVEPLFEFVEAVTATARQYRGRTHF